MSDPTDDEIDAALAAMDQPSSGPTSHAPTSTQAELLQPAAAVLQASEPPTRRKRSPKDMIEVGPLSQTLADLEENRLPRVRTVCENCPNSVWFASTVEVKCYCRVMYLVTWSTKEPNQLVSCDGLWLGQDEE